MKIQQLKSLQEYRTVISCGNRDKRHLFLTNSQAG